MKISKTNKLPLSLLFALILFTAIAAGAAQADTQYVSDMLIITLREGKSIGSKVIKRLKSDDPVSVLAIGEKYMKIRTKDGYEGWVSKKYITPVKPKSEIMAGLKNELSQLRTKVKDLEKTRASLWDDLKASKASSSTKKKDFVKTQEEVSRLAKELEQVTEKHNTLLGESKKMSELLKERDRLQTESNVLSQQLIKHQKESRSIGMLWWFAAGAGVFFAGLISGMVAKKKKYYIDI